MLCVAQLSIIYILNKKQLTALLFEVTPHAAQPIVYVVSINVRPPSLNPRNIIGQMLSNFLCHCPRVPCSVHGPYHDESKPLRPG